MSDVYSLAGRNAVVTGLSSGIGQAIAVALAREGANVAGDFLSNAEGAAETARLIEAQGRESLILQGDTGDETHIEALADAVVERWGHLDVWVNNAARLMVRPFLRDHHGSVARPPGRQPARLLLRLQGRRGAHAHDRLGPHHQHHLGGGRAGHQRPVGLRHRQGRHRGPHQGAGARAGRARHHRQRRRPGRHGDAPQRRRLHAGGARHLQRAHRPGPHRGARGGRRRRGLHGLPRVALHHRPGDHSWTAPCPSTATWATREPEPQADCGRRPAQAGGVPGSRQDRGLVTGPGEILQPLPRPLPAPRWRVSSRRR